MDSRPTRQRALIRGFALLVCIRFPLSALAAAEEARLQTVGVPRRSQQEGLAAVVVSGTKTASLSPQVTHTPWLSGLLALTANSQALGRVQPGATAISTASLPLPDTAGLLDLLAAAAAALAGAAAALLVTVVELAAMEPLEHMQAQHTPAEAGLAATVGQEALPLLAQAEELGLAEVVEQRVLHQTSPTKLVLVAAVLGYLAKDQAGLAALERLTQQKADEADREAQTVLSQRPEAVLMAAVVAARTQPTRSQPLLAQ